MKAFKTPGRSIRNVLWEENHNKVNIVSKRLREKIKRNREGLEEKNREKVKERERDMKREREGVREREKGSTNREKYRAKLILYLFTCKSFSLS